MSAINIAAPYAKALFSLSLEQPDPEKIFHDIRLVSAISQENKGFRLMLKSPIISAEKKHKIMDDLFSANLEKLTLSFIHILIRKKREMYLKDIVAEFMELYKDHKGILTTRLKTAMPATPVMRDQMIGLMKEKTGKEIELVEEVRSELIGGFILEWKDKQYDASILNQIKKLRSDIARINLYLKGY